MKKIIVVCPHCKNKMRINNKIAKYRCPTCKKIYKFSYLKKIIHTFKSFFLGIIQTILDIKNNIIKKYRDTKATYKYMKQLKQNMKNNPNWSNYRNQQQYEKRMKQAVKPSFWDRFKR